MQGAIAVVLCAACSGGEGLLDAPALASGSRLKAMWWVGPDGRKLVPAADYWFDSQLGIPCWLDYADDGKVRCRPRTFAGALSSLVRFADPACTQEAIFGGFSPTEACPLSYNPKASGWAYGPAPPPACNAGYPAVPITGYLPANPTSYYRDPSGRCVADGVWPFGYTTGPAVPASTFVAFGEPAPSGSGRLRPQYLIAEDGSRQWAGIWDASRGETCYPTLSSDGRQRCLPAAKSAFFFLDAQCTQPLHFELSSPGSCAAAPKTLFKDQEMCGGATLHEVGAPMTPSALYVNSAGTCMPLARPPPPGTFYTVGAVIPPDRFAELTDVTLTRGRILAHALAADGAIVQPPQLLHDPELDADVSPSPLSASTVALIPTNVAGTSLFADAGCTRQIAEAVSVCGRTSRFVEREASEGMGCSWSRHVHLIGPAIDPPQVFSGSPGTCTPAMKPDSPLFEVAAELAPSNFVTVTLVHD